MNMNWAILPRSDSSSICMREERLMNCLNLCTDPHLQLLDQETNCSIMRGIYTHGGWTFNASLQCQSCPWPRYKGGQGSRVLQREHPSLLTFCVDLCRLETAGTLTAHQQRCNKELAHKHRARGMCSHPPSLFHFPLSPQLGQTKKSWVGGWVSSRQ